MVGWQESDLIGVRPPFLYWPTEEIGTITHALGEVVEQDSPASGLEFRFARRDGDRIGFKDDGLARQSEFSVSAASVRS